MPATILISESFGPTRQVEGALCGTPSVFVRTGGCDCSCSWCDTLYAVLPEYRHGWQPITPDAVIRAVLRLWHRRPLPLTLWDGKPALQSLEPLLDMGHARGLRFALETQGWVARPWFAKLNHLVLSPKPPSSGMQADFDSLSSSPIGKDRAVCHFERSRPRVERVDGAVEKSLNRDQATP